MSSTSANFGPVTSLPPIAPTNTTPPTIVGAATVGTILTISGNIWAGRPAPILTYAWKRNGVAIASAATYQLVTADIANNITVTVTANNAGGTASADSTNAIGPVVAGNKGTYYYLGF